MSLITELGKIIEESRLRAEEVKSKPFLLTEENQGGHGDIETNILFHGDNFIFMKALLENKDMEGKLQLIYIDPPFFSKASYDASVKVGDSSIKHLAYEDKWNGKGGLENYLTMLTSRMFLMKELLKDDGLIWLHLDWHVVHYAKIIMDEIFGRENFVNEIIWNYKSGGSTNKHFARKHDTILVYSKTENYKFFPIKEKSYNRGYKPYRFKGVEEFQDELGWYTMVNMKDVWNIDMVGRTSSERTGYATQKPEQLLKRIIESSTEPGDLCADFFCGSGTLPSTASAMGRGFVACDVGTLAIESTALRLDRINTSYRIYNLESIKKNSLSVNSQVSILGDTVKVEILKVKERALNKVIEKKSEDVVRSAMKRDSIKMLSHWSVDFNYDGMVHRPSQCFIAGKNGIAKEAFGDYTKESSALSIKYVDVLGNVAFERVDYETIIEK